MDNKIHKPDCLLNVHCLVIHPDGICPGPYGTCTCNITPPENAQRMNEGNPFGLGSSAPKGYKVTDANTVLAQPEEEGLKEIEDELMYKHHVNLSLIQDIRNLLPKVRAEAYQEEAVNCQKHCEQARKEGKLEALECIASGEGWEESYYLYAEKLGLPKKYNKI